MLGDELVPVCKSLASLHDSCAVKGGGIGKPSQAVSTPVAGGSRNALGGHARAAGGMLAPGQASVPLQGVGTGVGLHA